MNNTPTTTSNIILKINKQLSQLGLAIMWFELIAIIWMIDSLFARSDWSNMTIYEYGITFSSLLLALILLFLLHTYRISAPKSTGDAILFKQEKFEKPILLRALLAIQVIIFLYGAFSSNAWGLLYTINIFNLDSIRAAFNLIVFFALHITIIVSIAFLLKLAQVGKLTSNSSSEDIIDTRLKKSYNYITILCTVVLVLLLYRLIPKLPVIFTDIGYLITSAQGLLFIYLSNIILTLLLVCLIILPLWRKKILERGSFYKWTAIFVIVDLYTSLEVVEGGVRVLLEYPSMIMPILLSIITEALLIASFIRVSTYSTLKKRFTFINEAVDILQKSFAGDAFFIRIFGNADDRNNNDTAYTYLHHAVSTCDKQGDICTYKDVAALGWIMGEFFPPTPESDLPSQYKEIELVRKHKETSEKIISDNALEFAYIWLVGTAPEFRKRGLAKVLIEKTLHQMAKADVQECWLDTTNNDDAEYYKKFGFKLFAEQVSELGVTTYVMVNKLANRTLTI